MIKKANELDFSQKKIKMILAGYAGIGKTTLALSAPKPLLIDLDKGIDRVEAPYRKDTLIASSLQEIMDDLQSDAMKQYETIIIDTGGKLLDIMKPVVIAENAQNGQRDGSLSLKGWGAVARKFKVFSQFVNSLDKHLVYIFHTVEFTDNDTTKLRIAIEGSSKNKIWEEMDLGGFIEMQGKNRTIGFSNNERYYAKATHGIKGVYTIPELKDGVENTFLTDLFNTVIQDLQNDVKAHEGEKVVYDKAMTLKSFITKAKTADELTSLLEKITNIPHALTSERELKSHLLEKSKELGFKYDSETKQFV